MMRTMGPRGSGEQGLLGTPPTAHKNKPKFFMYNTHTPHNTHTHNGDCTQSNINTHSRQHTHRVYTHSRQHTHRVYTHSHRRINRRVSTKTHTHTHHIRHTHTRHTVSEGFTFTHPDLCAHKLTWEWFNKTKEPSFTGVLHTFTGVLHTTRPWFRQILPLQENGRKGSQVRQDRRFQQRLDDDRIRREQFQQRRGNDRIQREHQALN